MGEAQKRAVAPDPDGDEQQPEFMLDLIWWRNKDSNDIDLAVESEWGANNAIWYDFGKLLAVKAPLKLLVYSTSNHNRQSLTVREGIEEKYMKRFTCHISGECYLLVEFVAPENKVYAYSFSVPRDGALAEVNFQERLAVALWPEASSHTART
jgi:hypothetical protein